MKEAHSHAWPGPLEHYWWVHSATELRRNWKDCQFFLLQYYRINKIMQKLNAEKHCYERNQIFWGIKKNFTENQTQICKIFVWEKLCLKICERILDWSLYWKNVLGEPLIFVSTCLASGKDAVPLSQCNCPNLHQLSFCFFVCVALSAPLPRKSKHSLFFPGSKKSQRRRIQKFPYLFFFHFCN